LKLGDGRGEVLKRKDACKKCKGKRTLVEKKPLNVFVEKGMVDQQKIKFSNEGDQQVTYFPLLAILILTTIFIARARARRFGSSNNC
jgi:DnaJ-class molecular chaperone